MAMGPAESYHLGLGGCVTSWLKGLLLNSDSNHEQAKQQLP